jgi:hypothetical protein
MPLRAGHCPGDRTAEHLRDHDGRPATWDFTAVHVRGAVRIETTEETLEVVQTTALTHEAAFDADWYQTGSLDYFRRIVVGVGPFRVTVISAEGLTFPRGLVPSPGHSAQRKGLGCRRGAPVSSWTEPQCGH